MTITHSRPDEVSEERKPVEHVEMGARIGSSDECSGIVPRIDAATPRVGIITLGRDDERGAEIVGKGDIEKEVERVDTTRPSGVRDSTANDILRMPAYRHGRIEVVQRRTKRVPNPASRRQDGAGRLDRASRRTLSARECAIRSAQAGKASKRTPESRLIHIVIGIGRVRAWTRPP